jgi:diphthamide synthase (EF-2-diphthine--ammonia ligase)
MMKVLVSWSSGKDSAWMLHQLKQDPKVEVGGLLTTMNDAFDRVAMHAVRRSLLEAQSRAAGVAVRTIPLPWPCSNEHYEGCMQTAVAQAVAEGFTHVAFGDCSWRMCGDTVKKSSRERG